MKSLSLLLLLLLPVQLWGAELKYELYGYGTKHLVLIIGGEGAADLSSNLSSDGLSLRVSGIDASFVAKDNSKSLPSMVSQLNQVKREPYTELLLSFSAPFELSAFPGAKELRVVLKAKSQAVQVPPAAQATAKSAPTNNASEPSSTDQSALLEQLTSELVRLRADLETKEQELKKLRETCNAN